MKKLITLTVFLALSALTMSFSNSGIGKGDADISKTSTSKPIKWMTMEEAIEANKRNPKKIFIDLYTDWCVVCVQMETATLNNPQIATYINENFYPVKLDAERKQNLNFKNKNFAFRPNEGRSGIHEMALYLTRGRVSYPSVVFMDENMSNPQPVPGFQNPVRMDKLLHFFGEDYYKSVDWGLFNQLFTSALEQP